MKNPDDIWEDIGSLSEMEAFHTISKLFDIYEKELKRNPESQEAKNFFRHLDNAIVQTTECNSNRR